MSAKDQADHGNALESWREKRFKENYFPLSGHLQRLLKRVRSTGLKIAIASSAKKDQLDQYLDIAHVGNLVDEKTSSGDVEESKPAPDIFEAVLKKLNLKGTDTVAVGDTPYDAEAACKAGIQPIGVLCGGFVESSLREAGCVEVYPGPASIYCCFTKSLLAKPNPLHRDGRADAALRL